MNNGTDNAANTNETETLTNLEVRKAMKLAASYAREVSTPANKRQGLSNHVQIVINQISAGDLENAVFTLADLLDAVNSNANPYNIGRVERKRKPVTYRGNVNVD